MEFDISILNGSLDTDFSVDNYLYYVDIDDNVECLDFVFLGNPDLNINVVGNENFGYGNNYVFVEILYNDKVETYTFIAKKEENTLTVLQDDFLTPLEVKGNSVNYDVAPLIIVVTSLLIILSYRLIFHKKSLMSKH